MAESLVLPVVRAVLGKAADALVQNVTSMWGVDADRHRLQRHLVFISSMLADAEVKSETNPAVTMWMKALKAVAYKADDVLDGFQYEALRCEALRNRSMASKVLCSFTSKNRLVFRYKASKDLKDVLDEIEGLVSEMNQFGLVERAEASKIPYRQTHSALDSSAEIFGRDDDKATVVNLLLDQGDQKNVQVLPIIGMGGLGKTTLAKMVYNDHKIQKHFELKMWHCVSENFEATAVVRSVIELATNGRCDLPDNIELLRRKLQEVIGRKKFLLVLDDVWNEEQHRWEDDLKPLLCSSIGGSGSMIVVTTRSTKVASIMGTLPPRKPACLSEGDSWKMFSKKAFSEGVKEQEELVMIGKRIVNKCTGLPLALKTMGGLMSSKQEVDEWETIANCNISDTRRGKDEVMSILKLSYRHLPPEMKQCFAFCAVFPKDYEMEKDILIQLWMSNGYIQKVETLSLEQKGEFIFNELVWRSFLQDVQECFRGIECKMHDLMHDLAKDVTEECVSVEELIKEQALIKDVRHLEISCHEKEIRGLLKSTSSLRTLLNESEHKDLEELELMSLRALRCKEPSNRLVSHAKYLRSLDLSWSKFDKLPDSICILYNLQSLRLDGCYNLQYLPEGMATSLRKLRHIHLFGCNSLKEMPPKLSLLHKLHTLTKFIVGTKDGHGIEELKYMQELGNRLELHQLRKVKKGSKANLDEKHNLTELELLWGRKSGDTLSNDEINDEEELLESLVPPRKLKYLHVNGYGGVAISQWMREPEMFQCLRNLKIGNCPRCTDIPIVWLSPSLEELDLYGMDSLTTLCKNINLEPTGYRSSLEIFPRLKVMDLYNLPNLERWIESSAGDLHSSVVLPQLEDLSVSGCLKLRTLPEGPLLTQLQYYGRTMPGNIPVSMPLRCWPSLVNLSIELPVNVVIDLDQQQGHHLEALRKLEITGDDAFTSVINMSTLQLRLGDALAFVEELEINSCSNIIRWPVDELQYLRRLRSLRIFACENLDGVALLSEEILPLPLLERLQILCCDNLLKIPQLPASLEDLEIHSCRNLMALPSNLGNLANLRTLDVSNCGRLQALPDEMDGLSSLEDLEIHSCRNLMALPSNLGNLANLRTLDVSNCGGLQALPDEMDGLSSLEELRITVCPGIEEFPQSLLQRLPSLKSLCIKGSPELTRRCREGGEYFDLVSSIPQKDIESETEEIEKPVSRFLPWCGGDSLLHCPRF